MERSLVIRCVCSFAVICVCLAMLGTAVAQRYEIRSPAAPPVAVAQPYGISSPTAPLATVPQPYLIRSPGAPPAAVLPAPTVAPDAEGRVSVHLRDGSCLVGELLGMEELAMETAFGKVTIPRKLVARVQFAGPPKAATVQFGNGDRLTGELTLAAVRLKTSFGEVSIEMEEVLSVACGTVSHIIYRPIVETRPDGTMRTRYVAEEVTRYVPTVPAPPSAYPCPPTSYPLNPTSLVPQPPVYQPPTLPAPSTSYQPVPGPATEAPSQRPLR